MSIDVSKPVVRLLLLANIEAWRCRASSIEPVHFWIACLKFSDPKIAEALFDGGVPPEECTEQAAAAREILAYLEIDAERAATLRRELRGRLLRGNAPRESPDDGDIPYLHRSESSRRLFVVAKRKAEEQKAGAVTPLHIAESLFDMQLASLGDL